MFISSALPAGWQALQAVRSEEVIAAALFDLLFSVCDRHASNVFLDDASRLTLIDHDMLTLNDTWRPCGVSSLFLPTTRKFEELIHGAAYVRGRDPVAVRPDTALTPALLLDYRCHAPGGAIGTDYPPAFVTLMARLAAMSPADIMMAYGLLDRANAVALHTRAADMLRLGFEGVLGSASGNDPGHSYDWQPPCCEMRLDRRRLGPPVLRCAHPWQPIVHPRPSRQED